MSEALVVFVGNELLRDDGIGPACFRLFLRHFEVAQSVDLLEVGCMTADLLGMLEKYDFILTVDALDVVGAEPGTIFAYSPSDMARLEGRALSLHDMRLADLFDMAALVGYECEGFCLGMQIDDIEPPEFDVGLTKDCKAALPALAQAVADELVKRGYAVRER